MDYQQNREQALDYNTQGKTLYSMDRFEEALNYYKKAEECDPMYAGTYLNQGECLIMLDRFEEAEAAYQKILLIDKGNGEAFFNLGNVAFLREDVERGREYYAKALNAGFEQPDMYMNLGYMLFSEGHYEEAVLQFNKALALDKFHAHAWLNKAKANVAMGRFPEALQALDGMIQYVPEVFEGHHYKYLISMQMGDQDTADETLKRMERMFPDDEGVWMDRLVFIEMQGDAAKAMAYYEQKFADSEEPAYLMEKAKILSGIDGRIDESLSLLEKLIGCEDEEVARQALSFAVIIAISAGKLDIANRHCDTLLAQDVRDEHYYNCLYFKGFVEEHLGNAYEAKRAYEKAVAELRMASSKDPGTLDYYVLRIMALRALGETQKAFELVNYLLTVNPDMPEALYVRAEMYEAMHMDEEAKADHARLGETSGMYSSILQTLSSVRK